MESEVYCLTQGEVSMVVKLKSSLSAEMYVGYA